MADTLQEFKILLNQNPHGPVYYPGSEVTGALVVKTTEPKSYNSIVVYLQGKGHVYWMETSGSGRKTDTYLANESYIDLTNSGWSRCQAPDNILSPGEYHFQFRFLLPTEVPSSYKSRNGWIRYTLGGQIDRGYPHSDLTTEIYLTVSQIVDINTPQLRLPITIGIEKTAGFLCCTSGPVTTTLELPRTGYCIGEEIPFRVTIENHGNHKVRVTASLLEQVTYHARSHRKFGPTVQHALVSSDKVNPRQTLVWMPKVQVLKIPITARPQLDSNIIKRRYQLRITTLIPNVLINPVLTRQLKIGNVPYRPDTAPPPYGPAPLPGAAAPPLGAPPLGTPPLGTIPPGAPYLGAPPPDTTPPGGCVPPSHPDHELTKEEPAS